MMKRDSIAVLSKEGLHAFAVEVILTALVFPFDFGRTSVSKLEMGSQCQTSGIYTREFNRPLN